MLVLCVLTNKYGATHRRPYSVRNIAVGLRNRDRPPISRRPPCPAARNAAFHPSPRRIDPPHQIFGASCLRGGLSQLSNIKTICFSWQTPRSFIHEKDSSRGPDPDSVTESPSCRISTTSQPNAG